MFGFAHDQVPPLIGLEALALEPRQIGATSVIGAKVVTGLTVIATGADVAEQPFEPVTVTVGLEALVTEMT